MVITVWAAAGRALPNLPATSPFTDTDQAEVLYCYQLGLVDGYGGGLFGPQDPLTRQQMFCILAAMLQSCGVDTTVDMNILSDYADGWSASDWALPATALMLQLDIAAGTGGWIQPTGLLTREQALATLWRTWGLMGSSGLVGDAPATVPGEEPWDQAGDAWDLDDETWDEAFPDDALPDDAIPDDVLPDDALPDDTFPRENRLQLA